MTAPAPRKLNVFFDVDHTLVMPPNNTARRHIHDVFRQLTEMGHSIYVWSGLGIREWDMRRNGVDQFVSGYYTKPLFDYRARLVECGIMVVPDFVIDDHPAVVADFDGYQISDIGSGDDDELLEVLRLIEDHASKPVDDLAP